MGLVATAAIVNTVVEHVPHSMDLDKYENITSFHIFPSQTFCHDLLSSLNYKKEKKRRKLI